VKTLHTRQIHLISLKFVFVSLPFDITLSQIGFGLSHTGEVSGYCLRYMKLYSSFGFLKLCIKIELIVCIHDPTKKKKERERLCL